tara:strand:+ start:1676 stop:2764 length:1089 start_codon:yes stop_codon:yes gene_type:complete
VYTKKNIDWVDLPFEDYSLILGYENQNVKHLDALISSYHQIAKNEETKLQTRIESLDTICSFLEAWLESGPSKIEKTKHLRFILDIAQKKKNYLFCLIHLYKENLHSENAQFLYHHDFSKQIDPKKTAIVLNNVHWFSLKQKHYWGDFWMDSLDPCKRVLTPFHDQWKVLRKEQPSTPHFFLWLETQFIPNYTPRVHYFDDQERENSQVIIHHNKLCFKKGFEYAPVHTHKGDRTLFIIDLDEKIYVAHEKVTEFGKTQHSSFNCGKPVLGAGLIQVREGIVTDLALESGHYLPDTEIGYQIICILKSQGLCLEKLTLHSFYDRNKYTSELESKDFISLNSFQSTIDNCIKEAQMKKESALH